jgi:hypothetical protein
MVLTSQYRIRPQEGKPVRVKIPRIPDFDLAIDLLFIQSHLDESLKKIHETWKKALKMK